MTAIVTAIVDDTAQSDEFEPISVPWWSFTKTVLTAAALVLVADGRLGLDAPLDGRPFTLRQLLQHRAGVADYGQLAAYHEAVANRETPWSRDTLLRCAGADNLAFAPGQGWAYSNIGSLFVRDLVEDAAGAELGPALDRLVLAPLGVAGVVVAREPADMAATAWGNAAGYHPGWVYHGLLVGPAGSAARLLHRLLAGALLPPKLLAEMLWPHPVGGPMSERPWLRTAYGLGVGIGRGETGATYIGHTGAGPGSTAAVYWCEPGRTAAAFAPVEHPAFVEREAMRLAQR